MGKHSKTRDRIDKTPTCADLNWKELITYMESIEFKKLEGRGSRVKFFHEKTQVMINIHKPHPKKILKKYAVELIREKLVEHDAQKTGG